VYVVGARPSSVVVTGMRITEASNMRSQTVLSVAGDHVDSNQLAFRLS